jgi:hypothetical protein
LEEGQKRKSGKVGTASGKALKSAPGDAQSNAGSEIGIDQGLYGREERDWPISVLHKSTAFGASAEQFRLQGFPNGAICYAVIAS